MLYPLTFRPLFKERVWGGNALIRLYGKPFPADVPVGESWEISDRPGDVSVIANGPLAGRDLRWLMGHHAREVLGTEPAGEERFPLLVKLLDARQTLSLQVHPPARQAAELGGEPKTELWHVLEARPGAVLYAGLKRGVTRAEFERRLRDGSVAECVHRLPVRACDTLFLPSGRLHALGAGIVVCEIQQNSDTTYRVFDWNRVGLDGRPRRLHVVESLASIDFSDIEPQLVTPGEPAGEHGEARRLVSGPPFAVDAVELGAGQQVRWPTPTALVLVVLEGVVALTAGEALRLNAGQSCLLPAAVGEVRVRAEQPARLLRAAPM